MYGRSKGGREIFGNDIAAVRRTIKGGLDVQQLEGVPSRG
jgi:hypothetical protein